MVSSPSSKDVLSNNLSASGEMLSSASGDLESGDIEDVPTPPKPQKIRPEHVSAVYLTGWSAGTKSKRESVIENLKEYGFTAVVIDIKDEDGRLSYKSNVQTAIDISASKNMIADIEGVLKDFHDAGIYVIGRIVTFKDPTYAKNVTSIAYKKADGSLWKDSAGNYWPNPYNSASWEYPIALAKEAATLGFDEVQFDYIRFPSSEGKTSTIEFGFDSDTKTKAETIQSFLKKVKSELADYDVVFSADVFGVTTKRKGDFEHIGQDFYEIAKIVDVICPMVYPSHYGFGEYNLKAPDTEPYKLITYSMQDALKQYDSSSGDTKLAVIRPYLQDFSAKWLGKGKYILYDTDAVLAQIQACSDLDIHDFTLWDPSNKYAYEALNMVKEKVIQPETNTNSSGDSNLQ